MIKKISLAGVLVFLVGVVVFGMCALTTAPAWPAEKNRVEYIKNSFRSFENRFFEEAKHMCIPGIASYSYIADDTEPKTTSYYLVVYGRPGNIILIYASKEVKLNDDVVEIYREGIYLTEFEKSFQYDISHITMDQNNNCKEKDIKPLVEIWDEVIDKLIFNKEDRVQYIKDSFDSFGEYFFINAEKVREGSSIHYFLKKEMDPRTTSYYLTVTTNAYIPMYIISVIVRKEIEMEGGLMEWYQEGITLNRDINKYRHNISHGLMDRSNNCEIVELDPAKVWDSVIANLFQ